MMAGTSLSAGEAPVHLSTALHNLLLSSMQHISRPFTWCSRVRRPSASASVVGHQAGLQCKHRRLSSRSMYKARCMLEWMHAGCRARC